ncbi:MAG: AEC family transporter, partial [Oscillospiraceae bacterium]|nr:AEC family transporter [Oscillospiraceae bacterium]
MLSTQIEILLIIICGYVLGKRGVLSPKARAEITNVVIYVVLPCNIFASFGKDTTAAMLKSGAVILAVGFGMQLLYGIFNLFLWRNRLFSKEQVSVAKYATYCNNSGFMGLPIIESFYGETGMFYGAINLIPIRIVMWTAGLSQFTATSWRSKVRVLATHPCIWAVILGIGYIFAPFE